MPEGGFSCGLFHHLIQTQINQIAQGNRSLEEVASDPDRAVLYPVIYADPPWKYEDVQSESRAIEYPTMDLDDICALPVSDLATPDAVLFLWATSPKLAESLEVITALGFNYPELPKLELFCRSPRPGWSVWGNQAGGVAA